MGKGKYYIHKLYNMTDKIVNEQREAVKSTLTQSGFTDEFARDVLDKLTPEGINRANPNLESIKSQLSKMNKNGLTVDEVVKMVKTFDATTSNKPFFFGLNSVGGKRKKTAKRKTNKNRKNIKVKTIKRK
jgi:hypothetical protein